MNLTEYIQSGLLEMYVLGLTSPEETHEVEQMSASHKEIREEIEKISEHLERYAAANSKAPPLTVKPMLLATIDYMERLKKGEPVSFPPDLNEKSRIRDYQEWLNRPDMVLPGNSENIYAKIIGHTGSVTTAIVWIKDMAPAEVHDHEHEKFLILEGECDIVVDGVAHHMIPGSFYSIPLHSSHHVKVTSPLPCKIILQRTAA
jgi:mannose-6-phosphate isomerase-like protein (cupin superfamily)